MSTPDLCFRGCNCKRCSAVRAKKSVQYRNKPAPVDLDRVNPIYRNAIAKLFSVGTTR